MIASIGILAVVMLFLMGVIVVASSGASSTLETATATAIAERELARLKTQSFNSLVAKIGSNPSTLIQDKREFRIQTEIERLDTSPGSPDYDILTLVTVVNWDTRTVNPTTKSREGRVRLETQVSSLAAY